MRTIEQIADDIREFERQFAPAVIPAGTPDRKRLQRAAYDEAARRSCMPENISRRRALWADKKAAERREKAKRVAERLAACPEHRERQRIFRALRTLGFRRECTSGRSAYYRRIDIVVRISDHDVPETPERIYARENGGFSWADSGNSFVVGRDDADQFIHDMAEIIAEAAG